MSEQEIQNIVQANTALRNEVTILKEQLALLQEQYDWLKKQVFGRKSEQTSVIMDGGTQLSLFPEEKEQAVSSVVETVSVIEATAAVVTAIGTTAVGIAKLVEATKN